MRKVKYVHCLNCGVDLTKQQVNKRYVHCSKECKAYVPIQPCRCRNCHSIFTPIGRDRMTFCSRPCADDYRQEHRMPIEQLILKNRMRNGIRLSLKYGKDGRSWLSLVDYTIDDLTKRLKRTIPKGYTWQCFIDGKLWIDHIIPIKVFNFTKPEHIDFKRCWALSNLQLLTAKGNMEKGCKIDKHFQPGLLLREGG